MLSCIDCISCDKSGLMAGNNVSNTCNCSCTFASISDNCLCKSCAFAVVVVVAAPSTPSVVAVAVASIIGIGGIGAIGGIGGIGNVGTIDVPTPVTVGNGVGIGAVDNVLISIPVGNGAIDGNGAKRFKLLPVGVGVNGVVNCGLIIVIFIFCEYILLQSINVSPDNSDAKVEDSPFDPLDDNGLPSDGDNNELFC